MHFQNKDSGSWTTRALKLRNTFFNQSLNGADVALHYEGGQDTVFHMIEIEKAR